MNTLRHLPVDVRNTVLEFRRSRRAELVPGVVRGLVERYVEPDLRHRLTDSGPDLRLAEHLGIDSLSLMELGMFAEDALGISIDNRELCAIRTLGEFEKYITAKLR